MREGSEAQSLPESGLLSSPVAPSKTPESARGEGASSKEVDYCKQPHFEREIRPSLEPASEAWMKAGQRPWAVPVERLSPAAE